jgi:protein ImuB
VSNPSNPKSLLPNPCSSPPLYACLYRPPALDQPASDATALAAIAKEFSPRFECHRDDLVSIDVSGLERLLGRARAIGEELRRDAATRGVGVHVAVAARRMTALVLAHARPGVTIVEPGGEAAAVAPVAIGILERIGGGLRDIPGRALKGSPSTPERDVIAMLTRWGVKTLGDLAALPPADLVSRLGRHALAWQALARGEDLSPLIPTLDEERFESSLELEWPIEGLEPLSFVLTRLLEPLSTRLERRDRGAAVLHVLLRLVTRASAGAGESREMHARRLELPSPMRDVRALRTLALLDLESHPPPAAIDAVTVVIDPTPGRVLQHTLFTRAHPTPEQLSTLVARLDAWMGQDRLGAPAMVDSYRPGAFAMVRFATEHKQLSAISDQRSAMSHQPCLVSTLRRCRQPVPARVTVADGQPVRVTTERRGFVGGSVVRAAGPWRSSGNWWTGGAGGSGRAGGSSGSGGAGRVVEASGSRKSGGPPDPAHQAHQAHQAYLAHQTHQTCWDRDEWDVALNDGAVYRIFQDRDTEAWFVDGIVD